MKAMPDLLKYSLWVPGTSAFLILTLILTAQATFGSVNTALHWFYGRHLFIENPVGEISLTMRQADEPVRLGFKVVNCSSKNVTVVEASSTCTCSIVNDLPLQVPANGFASTTLTVHLSSRGREETSGSIELFTDDPIFPVLTVRYRIHVASVKQPAV